MIELDVTINPPVPAFRSPEEATRLSKLSETLSAAGARLIASGQIGNAEVRQYLGPNGRPVLVTIAPGGVVDHYALGGSTWGELHVDLTR